MSDMTYGDWYIGRIVENTTTSELGRISSLGNGLIDVDIKRGERAGYTVTFSPDDEEGGLWVAYS